ncbi:alpha-D-ribose 1-methylphosphonate 5-triphosphate diphosphatase [Shimia sp. W99]
MDGRAARAEGRKGEKMRFIGGEVLTLDGALRADEVHVSGSEIATSAGGPEIDVSGCWVLPGMVDVHGDAFETALFPRPGVEMDFAMAMGAVDRQLLACGITTAYHGLSVGWEPGARGIAAARRFMSGLADLREDLSADHRVQLRWDVFAHEVVDDLRGWLRQAPVPALAFNDHTTETLETVAAGQTGQLEKWARRAGVSLEAYLADLEMLAAPRDAVPEMVQQVAAMAREAGAVMLGHDEATGEERAAHRALGVLVSEFPLSEAVAKAAVAAGEQVVLGAPNAARRQSHKGNLSAWEAVKGGTCTVLASDYYYPSLLYVVEQLVRDGMALGDAWALVSSNPARAMGLHDRGAIVPGKRADLLVIEPGKRWRIRYVVVGGVLSSFG